MIDLERALDDLAEHLDHPSGDGLVDAVRSRISTRGHARSHVVLAAAAVVMLIVLATLAIPPARHAVARWLGIGAIDVRRSEGPPLSDGVSGHTVPGVPGGPVSANASQRLAFARKRVDFTIVTPRDPSAGPLTSVALDRRVAGGLVALGYPRFTLVEVTASETGSRSIAKFVDPGTGVQSVTVNGQQGFWITGAHKIVFLDRDGNVETDSVRRAGPVLAWERGGVTYRLEGFDSLAAAQKVAVSVR